MERLRFLANALILTLVGLTTTSAVAQSFFARFWNAPRAFVVSSEFLQDIRDRESALTSLDLQIRGIRATHFEYKFGTASATNCWDSLNYSAPVALTERLQLDISGHANDTQVRLCVRGVDSNANDNRRRFVWKIPSQYNWTKIAAESSSPKDFYIYWPRGLQKRQTVFSYWQRSTDADTYDATVATDSGCSQVVQTHTGLTKRYVILDPLANGTYYMCVTARNASGSTLAKNNGRQFMIDNPDQPQPFSIVSPTGVIGDVMPTLTWEASVNAVQYDAVVATDANCDNPVFSAGNLTATSVTVATDLTDGVYFTCVTARSQGGQSAVASNNGLQFEVAAAAPQPFNILTPNGEINLSTPTVTWEPSIDAVEYDVTIATDAGCSVAVRTFTNVTGTTVSVSNALADGSYFTCVTAVGDNGRNTLATNNGLGFTINTDPPGPFNILGPDGTTNDNQPTVTWEESANADFYELTVATDAACTSIVQTHGDLADTEHTVDELADGSYFFCVTAFKNVATGQSQSSARGIQSAMALVETAVDTLATAASNNGQINNIIDTIAPASFSITGPTGSVSSETVTVTWEAASGAVRYLVAISLNPGCSSIVASADVTGTNMVFGGLGDGNYFSCVTARDAASNEIDADNNGLAFSKVTAQPGFHVLFATNQFTTITADTAFPPLGSSFGGIQGADWICNNAAFNAGFLPDWDGLRLDFKAVLSQSNIDARDRIEIMGEIRNSLDEVLAGDADDLWDGELNVAVGFDEFGFPVGVGDRVWTGTSVSGSASGTDCDSWLNPSAQGSSGIASSATTSWISFQSFSCGGSARLYCLSPFIPE